MSSADRPPSRPAQDVEHELGLLDRAREARPGRRRSVESPTVPWRCSRVGQRARARRASPRARRRRRGGQQRVDARRAVHVLGERARVLAGDRRDDVARAVGRQLGAEHDGAAREVAAQPRRRGARPRAARGPAARAGPPGTSRAGSARPPPCASSTATSVSEATAARWRNSAASGAARAAPASSSTAPDDVVAGRDRHLGREPAGTSAGRSAHAVGDVAAQRASARPAAAAGRGRPPRRAAARRSATGAPAASAASAATRREARRRRARPRPSRRWTARRLLDERAARAGSRLRAAGPARPPSPWHPLTMA